MKKIIKGTLIILAAIVVFSFQKDAHSSDSNYTLGTQPKDLKLQK